MNNTNNMSDILCKVWNLSQSIDTVEEIVCDNAEERLVKNVVLNELRDRIAEMVRCDAERYRD
jgi:hypothetical protein